MEPKIPSSTGYNIRLTNWEKTNLQRLSRAEGLPMATLMHRLFAVYIAQNPEAPDSSNP